MSKDYRSTPILSTARDNLEWDVPGRRFRVMLRLVYRLGYFIRIGNDHILKQENYTFTYGELYDIFKNYAFPLPFRVDKWDGTADKTLVKKMEDLHIGGYDNPSIHKGLQDLAFEFFEDVSEACQAFTNPDIHYAAPDPSVIEPVTDDHVHLVIAGIQRELQRETRPPVRNINASKLPAAPLKNLPFHIQRALVERRRYRFLQWGINREAYLTNEWYLCRVPEDAEWLPRSKSI